MEAIAGAVAASTGPLTRRNTLRKSLHDANIKPVYDEVDEPDPFRTAMVDAFDRLDKQHKHPGSQVSSAPLSQGLTPQSSLPSAAASLSAGTSRRVSRTVSMDAKRSLRQSESGGRMSQEQESVRVLKTWGSTVSALSLQATDIPVSRSISNIDMAASRTKSSIELPASMPSSATQQPAVVISRASASIESPAPLLDNAFLDNAKQVAALSAQIRHSIKTECSSHVDVDSIAALSPMSSLRNQPSTHMQQLGQLQQMSDGEQQTASHLQENDVSSFEPEEQLAASGLVQPSEIEVTLQHEQADHQEASPVQVGSSLDPVNPGTSAIIHTEAAPAVASSEVDAQMWPDTEDPAASEAHGTVFVTLSRRASPLPPTSRRTTVDGSAVQARGGMGRAALDILGRPPRPPQDIARRVSSTADTASSSISLQLSLTDVYEQTTPGTTLTPLAAGLSRMRSSQ